MSFCISTGFSSSCCLPIGGVTAQAGSSGHGAKEVTITFGTVDLQGVLLGEVFSVLIIQVLSWWELCWLSAEEWA